MARFRQEQINAAVDLLRRANEADGTKDGRFYRQNFLAKAFGIYTSLEYPPAAEITGMWPLWARFHPRYPKGKASAELAASIAKALYQVDTFNPEFFLAQEQEAMARVERYRNENKGSKLKVSFSDPYDVAARQIDESMSSAEAGHNSGIELSFRTEKEAFEYALEYMAGEVVDGSVLTGLVTDVRPAGPLHALLITAATDAGPIEIVAFEASDNVASTGDLVSVGIAVGEDGAKAVLLTINSLQLSRSGKWVPKKVIS